MSTGEVVKKRGRPKKVVEEAESVVEAKKSGNSTRKASTKAATSEKKTVKGAAPKTTKAATTRTKKAEGAPGPAPTATAKPTPASPSTSKIIQEVNAKGTLKTATSSSSNTTTTAQTPATPAPSPSPSTSTPNPPPTRISTIPIPPSPSTTPKPPPIPTTPSRPALSPTITPLSSRAPQPSSPYPEPLLGKTSKVHYPQDDGKLPAKYKPAARRVTAIMVALPVVFVFGWELYGRYVQHYALDHKHDFEAAHKPRALENGSGSSSVSENAAS